MAAVGLLQIDPVNDVKGLSLLPSTLWDNKFSWILMAFQLFGSLPASCIIQPNCLALIVRSS